MKVLAVTYKGNYDIHVLFEDGVGGTIHLNDLVEKGIFNRLKDTTQFEKVYTTGYSIAWSDQLEIDAATIYAELSGKVPGEVFSSQSYATN
ncbi:MAG: DUF2442 domain-containing protein [Sediminibacterium sp.]